jgi:CcmD family protein
MSDIYVVLIVCLFVWGGIFFYLLHIDKQLKNIKQKIDFSDTTKKE